MLPFVCKFAFGLNTARKLCQLKNWRPEIQNIENNKRINSQELIYRIR